MIFAGTASAVPVFSAVGDGFPVPKPIDNGFADTMHNSFHSTAGTGDPSPTQLISVRNQDFFNMMPIYWQKRVQFFTVGQIDIFE